jgi:hypothetical protein
MKKHLPYGGLLAAVSSISISSSSLSLKLNDTRPITKQPQAATQALLPAIQTILWLCLLAALYYINENGRKASRWQFDHLAILKAIKDNAVRLWDMHRPDRKVIRLED